MNNQPNYLKLSQNLMIFFEFLPSLILQGKGYYNVNILHDNKYVP